MTGVNCVVRVCVGGFRWRPEAELGLELDGEGRCLWVERCIGWMSARLPAFVFAGIPVGVCCGKQQGQEATDEQLSWTGRPAVRHRPLCSRSLPTRPRTPLPTGHRGRHKAAALAPGRGVAPHGMMPYAAGHVPRRRTCRPCGTWRHWTRVTASLHPHLATSGAVRTAHAAPQTSGCRWLLPALPKLVVVQPMRGVLLSLLPCGCAYGRVQVSIMRGSSLRRMAGGGLPVPVLPRYE